MNPGTPSPIGSPQYSMYDLLKNGRRPKPAQSLYTGTTVVSPMQPKKKPQPREPKKATEPKPDKPPAKRSPKKKKPAPANSRLSNSGSGRRAAEPATSSESESSSSESSNSTSETSDTASLDVIRTTGKKRLKDSKKDDAKVEIETEVKPEKEIELKPEPKVKEAKQPKTKKLKVIKDKLTLPLSPKEQLALNASHSHSNDSADANDQLPLSVSGSLSMSHSATATTPTPTTSLSLSGSRGLGGGVSTYTMKERSAKSKAVQYEKPQKITENGLVTLVTDNDTVREAKPSGRGGKGRPKNARVVGEKTSKQKEAVSAIDSDVEEKVLVTDVDAGNNIPVVTAATNNNNTSQATSNSNSNLIAQRVTNSKVTISQKKKDPSLMKKIETRAADLNALVGEKQHQPSSADAISTNLSAVGDQAKHGETSEGNNSHEAPTVNTSDGDFGAIGNPEDRSTLSLSISGSLGASGTEPTTTRAEKERALLQAEKEESGIALADLDLSHCERLESSYWRRPEHYELKKCSGRTPLCDSVLNDTWISRPTGEEGSQFRYSYKNAAEEEVFRTEDDQFEVDLYIERNFSTMKKLISIKSRIAAMPAAEQSQYKLTIDEFSKLHIHTIKIIYGMKNYPILQKALLEAPLEVIPIILDRMRQKSQEWSVMKQQWVPKWAKEYLKYHRKSLDHEGSNFKEEMKKLQDPNNIILDAKERTQENCLSIKFENRGLYHDVKYLFSLIAQTNLSWLQQQKLDSYLISLVDLFFSKKQDAPGNVLIANPILFIFFRYIQMLYDYLVKAVEVASRPYTLISYLPSACSLNSLPTDTERKILNPDKRVRYAFYYNTVVELTKRAIEPAAYEDDLRNHFGVSSYVLFGLDKLILNIGNHFQTIIKDENTLKLCAIYLHHHSQPLDQYRRCVHEHIVLKSCFDLCYSADACVLRMFASAHYHPDARVGASPAPHSLASSLTDFHGPPNHVVQQAAKKKATSHLNQFASHNGDFLMATALESHERGAWSVEETELYRGACDGGWEALRLEDVAGDTLDVETLVPPARDNPVRILFDQTVDAKESKREELERRMEETQRRLLGTCSPHLMDEFRAAIARLERKDVRNENSLANRLGDMRIEPKKEYLTNHHRTLGEQAFLKHEMETEGAQEKEAQLPENSAASANPVPLEAALVSPAIPSGDDGACEPSPRLPAATDSWQDLFLQLQRQPSNDSNGQISTFYLKRNIEKVRLKSNAKEFLASFSSCHLSNAIDRQQSGKLHYFKKTEDFFWRKPKSGTCVPSGTGASSLATLSLPQFHHNHNNSAASNSNHSLAQNSNNSNNSNNNSNRNTRNNVTLERNVKSSNSVASETPNIPNSNSTDSDSNQMNIELNVNTNLLIPVQPTENSAPTTSQIERENS